MTTRYRFKRADTQNEFEQISRLNHAVFAVELEQHQVQSSGRIVDKFHDKNAYVVALQGDRVIGMIALHDQPPFSVAGKLAEPDAILGKLGRMIEVRLLAVEPEHRSGRVMMGLMLAVFEYAGTYDSIIISGHVDKSDIYHTLGFEDLGPPVRSGEALYIPMAVRMSRLAERQSRWQRHASV